MTVDTKVRYCPLTSINPHHDIIWRSASIMSFKFLLAQTVAHRCQDRDGFQRSRRTGASRHNPRPGIPCTRCNNAFHALSNPTTKRRTRLRKTGLPTARTHFTVGSQKSLFFTRTWWAGKRGCARATNSSREATDASGRGETVRFAAGRPEDPRVDAPRAGPVARLNVACWAAARVASAAPTSKFLSASIVRGGEGEGRNGVPTGTVHLLLVEFRRPTPAVHPYLALITVGAHTEGASMGVYSLYYQT